MRCFLAPFFLIVTALFVGCSSEPEDVSDRPVRRDSIREVAIKYGAQSGLSWRSSQIGEVLLAHSERLGAIYDFRRLMIDAHVMPPVLQETRKDIRLNPVENVVRISDMAVEIVRNAIFVTNPPVWQQYIELAYVDPTPPVVSLLPQNLFERKIWDEFILEGWDMGVDQADDIFMSGIFRLNRDFMGMVLFHRLFEQGLVTRPYLSRTDLGITGDKSKIVVGDQVVRLTKYSEMQPKASESWDPLVVTHPDNTLSFKATAKALH